MLEVVIRFVDIGRLFVHHCLNSLSVSSVHTKTNIVWKLVSQDIGICQQTLITLQGNVGGDT